MNITIAPGTKSKIPANAHVQVQIASPFSGSELDEVGAVIALAFEGPDATPFEITGTHTGSTLVYLITPGLLAGGARYGVNPRVLASGYERHWPEPAILDVGANTLIRGCDDAC